MSVQLFISPRQHFEELVGSGFSKLKVQAAPGVQTYLVDLLEFYLDTRNLYPDETAQDGSRRPSTMAEMWLSAPHLTLSERTELLKQMGDRALYISGFFSESLQRKIVDVDYYAEMGGAAYARLADSIREDTHAHIYRLISRRFNEFADVLSYVSQQSMAPTDQNLLRLYERYLRTGSEIAREQLIENGVLTMPADEIKKAQQD